MDSSFSTLGFVIFGFSISFYALVVQSQIDKGGIGESSPALMVPPPPPPLPPPPSPATLEKSPPSTRSPPPLRHQRRRHHAPPNQMKKHAPKMKRSPPPPPPRQMNAGKKVGLLFVGIAAIMQVGMVGFLVFKRRQLLKTKDRYDTCS